MRLGQYDKIMLSPGPGIPSEAGIMQDLVAEYGPTKSILGICLGHQGIGEVYGATLENLGDVLHGVAHKATVTDRSEQLFADIPDELTVGRYHSWTVVPDSMPADLRTTAVDEQGRVMALVAHSFRRKRSAISPRIGTDREWGQDDSELVSDLMSWAKLQLAPLTMGNIHTGQAGAWPRQNYS